jgi:DNA-binding NarL/FixJ family response regulator
MPQTVLIVDDHPTFRATAHVLLESEGFRVVGEAATGLDAVTLARELHPDLVLLDVQLPDIDGFEVATRLRGNGGPAIVLVSSRDAADYGDLIPVCGARGFVPKAELSGAAIRALLA